MTRPAPFTQAQVRRAVKAENVATLRAVQRRLR